MDNALISRMTHAWNAQSVAPILALYRPDAVLVHPMGGELRGLEAIAAFEGAMFAGFSDITWQPLTAVTSGDTTAVEYEVAATNDKPLATPQGTLPATGRRVCLRAMDLIRVDGEGRIVEQRRYQDSASFFRQLGLG